MVGSVIFKNEDDNCININIIVAKLKSCFYTGWTFSKPMLIQQPPPPTPPQPQQTAPPPQPPHVQFAKPPEVKMEQDEFSEIISETAGTAGPNDGQNEEAKKRDILNFLMSDIPQDPSGPSTSVSNNNLAKQQQQQQQPTVTSSSQPPLITPPTQQPTPTTPPTQQEEAAQPPPIVFKVPALPPKKKVWHTHTHDL